MKNLLLSSLCAFALLSGAAVAQTTSPAPTAPTGVAPDTSTGKIFVTPGASDYSASELIGTKVTNRANETVGEIVDVMLDRSQAVRSVILSVGGFLGVGARYVAVQPAALSITKVDEKSYKASMDTTKDALKSAPEFKYTRKMS